MTQARFIHFCCFGILAIYMASVQVYKLWYIATAIACLVWLFDIPRTRWTLWTIIQETAVILLYWVSIAASVMVSEHPLMAHRWVAIDSIFLPIFVLFLTVGLFSPVDWIVKSFRILVWPALIAVIVFWDEGGGGRIGTRAWWILPFVVPFIVISIYRGKRLALAEFGVLFTILALTQTRVPLVTAVLAAALSFLWMKPAWQDFWLRASLSTAAILVSLFIAYQIPAGERALLVSYVRFTGQAINSASTPNKPADFSREQQAGQSGPRGPDSVASTRLERSSEGKLVVPPEHADEDRVKINNLYNRLMRERGLTLFGIGYGTFEIFFDRAYDVKRNFLVHSIYKSWLLEQGLFGCLVVAFLMGRFFWTIFDGARKTRSPDEVELFKSLAVGMVTFLFYGIFHPVIHGPMMFVLMGLGFGCYRALLARDAISSPATAARPR